MQSKTYTVVASLEFSKEFSKLPPPIQVEARKRLVNLQSDPFKGLPLKHSLKGLYSLHFHANKYRIIYTVEEDKIQILAISIGKRTNDFYKDFSFR